MKFSGVSFRSSNVAATSECSRPGIDSASCGAEEIDEIVEWAPRMRVSVFRLICDARTGQSSVDGDGDVDVDSLFCFSCVASSRAS